MVKSIVFSWFVKFQTLVVKCWLIRGFLFESWYLRSVTELGIALCYGTIDKKVMNGWLIVSLLSEMYSIVSSLGSNQT